MRRYLRLFAFQVRMSLVTAMQYRSDFLFEGAMSLYWVAWNLMPLLILYADRDAVAGWDRSSALVVIGWFVILRGMLEGAVNPSLTAVVESLRTGSFDYTLLKPADAQFLVSTARFEPWRIVDVLGGVGLIVWAFVDLGRAPTALDLGAGLALLASACTALYALWIMIICAAFYVVRLDNLQYLFQSVFDAARWPVQVFRGGWRFLFTFIIPLALMTTYPAMALLGTLSLAPALGCVGGSLVLLAIARAIWQRSIGNYTSASS